MGGSKALVDVRQLSAEREVLLGQLVDRAAVEELDAKNRALLQVRVDVLWFLSFVPSLALALTVYVCVTYVSKALAVWLGDCAGALEPHTHLVSQPVTGHPANCDKCMCACLSCTPAGVDSAA